MLTVKVWISKRPTLLHNIYRVRGETDLKDIMACRLPSILAGDFNAHHTMWCRSTDRAGRILLDQIENSNEYVIMNKPQIPTTQYGTTIDCRIVNYVGIVTMIIHPLTNVCARRARLCVWFGQANILFIDESMAVQILFFGFIILNYSWVRYNT